MEAVIRRLLSSADASVRLRTLKEILGEPASSPKVKKASAEMVASDRVRLLLSERVNGVVPYHPYAKWYGAHWILSVLADMGYPKNDVSLHPLREQVFEWLNSDLHLGRIRGREAYAGPVTRVRGLVRAHASLEGNALYYLNALGLADSRSAALSDRLAEWQWPDGGWNCDKRGAAHTSSFTESLLPLRGLAMHRRLRGGHADTVAKAADYFLERRLFRRKHGGALVSGKFTKLHYPCYWHYDVLFGLKVMKESGFIKDERCEEALSFLRSKRLGDGGFPAEEAYYQTGRSRSRRSLVSWGGASAKRMNEFVTCDALSVLGRATG